MNTNTRPRTRMRGHKCKATNAKPQTQGHKRKATNARPQMQMQGTVNTNAKDPKCEWPAQGKSEDESEAISEGVPAGVPIMYLTSSPQHRQRHDGDSGGGPAVNANKARWGLRRGASREREHGAGEREAVVHVSEGAWEGREESTPPRIRMQTRHARGKRGRGGDEGATNAREEREKRGGGRRAHGRELSTTLMQMQMRERGAKWSSVWLFYRKHYIALHSYYRALQSTTIVDSDYYELSVKGYLPTRLPAPTGAM
ncbi:hypothetical protein DFH94DRAFT_679715 [Russula ochroleuca]|uniref:Uncharacterized protein n=1 Tax=Russula ochroleuca TaxID=152965 RepID=A0A9P5N3I9_9AGAM|nr:hypothetical protein DFH94DRAFT_679715 [Russula ochroleuca]